MPLKWCRSVFALVAMSFLAAFAAGCLLFRVLGVKARYTTPDSRRHKSTVGKEC